MLLFVPVFLLLGQVHLGNTLQGLLLVYVGVSMPFTVFLLTGFFATLPVELNLVFLWTEFFWGLVLLRSHDQFTLGVALNSLREAMAFDGDWVGLFAAVVILMGPAILVYLVLSRRLLAALTFGSGR